ncbi:hypothetical protein D3C77_557990 [compost metagenome]
MAVYLFLRAFVVKFFEYRFIAAFLDRFSRLLPGTLQNKLVAYNIGAVTEKLHVLVKAGKELSARNIFFRGSD